MRAIRQPAHDPTTPFGALELGFERCGIDVAPFPQLDVDGAHGVRTARAAPTGLVRREQHFRAHERGDPRVLDDVVVVADQHADPDAVRCVEHREFVTTRNMRADKCMQLAMARDSAVRHRDDVRVEEPPVLRPLDQASADCHLMASREVEQDPG